MKLDKNAIGEPCPKCGQEITRSVVELAQAVKSANAIRSILKAKQNGSKMGRKKIRNDKEIRDLRNLGYTIREIAGVVGLSTTSVQRALKPKDKK